MKERIVYMCDPDKNVKCPKTECAYATTYYGGLCRKTAHREYAMTDENGEPIVATPEMVKKISEDKAWDDWGKKLESVMLAKPDEKGDCNGDACEI